MTMGIAKVESKAKIHCSETVESLLPCMVCLAPTRHRHMKQYKGRNYPEGSMVAICEDCCKEPNTKTIPPGTRSRYMERMMRCIKCKHTDKEIKFKRFKVSTWLTCLNCGIKKNKDAKDRIKFFQRIFVYPREIWTNIYGKEK